MYWPIEQEKHVEDPDMRYSIKSISKGRIQVGGEVERERERERERKRGRREDIYIDR